MKFSVHYTSNVDECEMVLSKALEYKSDLKWKQLNAERLIEKNRIAREKLDEQSLQLNDDLEEIQNVLKTSSSDYLGDLASERKLRLEYKLYLIKDRMAQLGNRSILLKELEMEMAAQQLKIVDAFIKVISERSKQLAK